MMELFTLFTLGDWILIAIVWAFLVAAAIMILKVGSDNYHGEEDGDDH